MNKEFQLLQSLKKASNETVKFSGPKLNKLEGSNLLFQARDSSILSSFEVTLFQSQQSCKSQLNNHFTDLHIEFFSDLQEGIKANDLKRNIWEEVCDNDSQFVDKRMSDEENEIIMNQLGNDDLIIHNQLNSLNPFTNMFKFTLLDNAFESIEYQLVEDISYKHYLEDEQQLLLKSNNHSKKQQKQSKLAQGGPTQMTDIEKEFGIIGDEVIKYFSDVQKKSQSTYQSAEKDNSFTYDNLDEIQVKRINQFKRVSDMFNQGAKKDSENRVKLKVDKLSIIDNSEEVFRHFKKEWEREQNEEEQAGHNSISALMANLDLDQMLNKVEERIVLKEEQERKIEEQLAIEESKGRIDEEMIKEIQLKNTQERNKIFNDLQLVDSSDISEKKLQLTTSYEWAVEDNMEIKKIDEKLPPKKMAQEYPFELDDFQKRSVFRMEQDDSVFVCAHTSAGKTVVAEYAIALSKKMKRKAIYTSPIKALSNQKYRDFKLKFGEDVGIVTGDVSLNPTASCLIVTTEILRNMLFKGHDIIRDIAWVIFDEVHYVNNQERGVVWEETIILLPENIGLVMLSATVPNYMNFANWVGRTKQRKIYVQKTNYRPVPLEHSIYLFDKFHVLKSGEETFAMNEYDNLKKMITLAIAQKGMIHTMKLQLKQEKKEKGIYKNTNMSIRNKKNMKSITERYIKNISEEDLNRQGSTSEVDALKNLLAKCQNEDLLPCVVFVFSKKKIQDLSESIGPISFCDFEEKKLIEYYFNRSARKIKQRDLNVPQIQTVKNLLLRGIAVHHGDVIPFIKEVVEILFSQGLIKVLFATETFAMGINMPTKTVIFHSLKKFDASGMRLLNSSEFTQMSGRAGRRGLDTKGTVVIFVQSYDQLPTKQDLRAVLDHRGEVLESKFKVSYESIINLLNSNVIGVVEMMKKSYQENDKYANLPSNIRRLRFLKDEYIRLKNYKCIKQESDLEGNVMLIDMYLKFATMMPLYSQVYFQQEKLYIQDKIELPCYCAIFDNKYRIYLAMIIYTDSSEECKNNPNRFVRVLHVENLNEQHQPVFEFSEDKFEFNVVENHHFLDESTSKEYSFKIFRLSLKEIVRIYEDDPNIEFTGLKDQYYVYNCVKSLISKKESFREHFISDAQAKTKMKRKAFKEICLNATQISQANLSKNLDSFYNSPCHSCIKKEDHLSHELQRRDIKQQLETIILSIDENNVGQKTSLENKLSLLKQLKYINEYHQTTTKAKIAKEVQNIYVAEIISQGILEFLQEWELATLLSGFSCQGKAKGKKFNPLDDISPAMPNYDLLIDTYLQIQKITIETITLEINRGIIVASSAEEYFQEVYNADLMMVVYRWMVGSDFQDICRMTNYQEGSIVRCFHRLENLLKNTRNCYVILGNYNMTEKLDSCMENLKKDIVFSKSLYLDQD